MRWVSRCPTHPALGYQLKPGQHVGSCEATNPNILCLVLLGFLASSQPTELQIIACFHPLGSLLYPTNALLMLFSYIDKSCKDSTKIIRSRLNYFCKRPINSPKPTKSFSKRPTSFLELVNLYGECVNTICGRPNCF